MKLRMERAQYRASMGERRDGYRVLVRKPERKSPLGRPDVNGRILRGILRKWDGGWYALD
jgi:hypothetical protein